MASTFARVFQRHLVPSFISSLFFLFRDQCFINPKAEVQLNRNIKFGKGTVVKSFAIVVARYQKYILTSILTKRLPRRLLSRTSYYLLIKYWFPQMYEILWKILTPTQTWLKSSHAYLWIFMWWLWCVFWRTTLHVPGGWTDCLRKMWESNHQPQSICCVCPQWRKSPGREW